MEKHAITHFDTYGREPVLRRMPDGTLVCTFLTGGEREPACDNVVMISRSADDGVTWSHPELLFSHSARAVWATEILCRGEIPMMAVQTYNAQSHYRELNTYFSYTYDSGKTWTEPVSVRGGIGGSSLRQGLRMSNGELLIPLYWQEITGRFDWEGQGPDYTGQLWSFRCGVGISSDEGDSWVRCGYIREEGGSLWEPNAVEIEPGHLMMYCRCSHGFLTLSESRDYGYSWSKPWLSDIPNSDTKVSVVKIRDTIFMISNFYSPIGWNNRTHLEIRSSRDGIHFSPLLQLEQPEQLFFYPHAYVDEDQRMLYVAYENGKDQRLAKVTFAELGL